MTLKLNGTNSEAAPAYAGDDADTGLQCGTNELKLVTGGTARATVNSSGQVGLGTTSPNKPLHIYSGSSDAEIRLQANSGTEQNSYIALRESSGDLDFYTVASGTNMKFHTANTERMRISADGYITKPNQPGMYFDGLDWTSSNNYMHNGHQFWQVGSNWNNTTGTWTCPVAGKYFVGADAQGHNVSTQTGASNQYANIIPRVNNSNVGLESVATTREDGGTGGSTATHTSFGFAIILSCNANDTIRVYSNHGFRTNTQNHLTIYLLG